ncbi:hypothetical protein NPIL_257461 [Nephila pilipes]|uniref:Uncharacterized protein n=1 Tax=Nephila pilipes TaxID=299642 RepID=A0A8X6MQV5_NEPPI|nr:hypothetical protein NPIL_257461 [Nephila pilipes]
MNCVTQTRFYSLPLSNLVHIYRNIFQESTNGSKHFFKIYIFEGLRMSETFCNKQIRKGRACSNLYMYTNLDIKFNASQ